MATMKRKAIALAVLAVLLLGAAAVLYAHSVAIAVAQANLMELRANGRETPGDFGTPFALSWIRSGPRRLEASSVAPLASCPDRTAVLVFHGRGETISKWARAQAFLAAHCVGSEVFDYSGHGASTPPATIANLDADALAAWSDFIRRYPRPWRRCVISHSMGSGPLLASYGAFHPAPDCAILASAFTSLGDLARRYGAPGPVADLLNDTWNNRAEIGEIRAPLLLVRSDADKVIPAAMTARLAAAAPASRVVIVHGFPHNAIYRFPSLAWWGPELAFLHRAPQPPERTTVYR